MSRGPVKDEWGEWTSALVPIRDTDKGTVVAVFGVDIDAKDWNMTVLFPCRVTNWLDADCSDRGH